MAKHEPALEHTYRFSPASVNQYAIRITFADYDTGKLEGVMQNHPFITAGYHRESAPSEVLVHLQGELQFVGSWKWYKREFDKTYWNTKPYGRRSLIQQHVRHTDRGRRRTNKRSAYKTAIVTLHLINASSSDDTQSRHSWANIRKYPNWNMGIFFLTSLYFNFKYRIYTTR